MASNLAKIRLTMGLRAVNSNFGKKLINRGINNIRNIFKYGVSKIMGSQRFNLNACKTLSQAELDSLSETALNFFPFYTSFRHQARTT